MHSLHPLASHTLVRMESRRRLAPIQGKSTWRGAQSPRYGLMSTVTCYSEPMTTPQRRPTGWLVACRSSSRKRCSGFVRLSQERSRGQEPELGPGTTGKPGRPRRSEKPWKPGRPEESAKRRRPMKLGHRGPAPRATKAQKLGAKVNASPSSSDTGRSQRGSPGALRRKRLPGICSRSTPQAISDPSTDTGQLRRSDDISVRATSTVGPRAVEFRPTGATSTTLSRPRMAGRRLSRTLRTCAAATTC